MCFATPEQVIELGPGFAVIERGGERLPILLHMLDEPVLPGDWLAVQAQRYAVAKLSSGEAEELIELYATIDAYLQPLPSPSPRTRGEGVTAGDG